MTNFKFQPGVYSFHLMRDTKEKKIDIIANIEKGKKKEQIDNMKWSAVRRLAWYNHLSCAVIGIDYVETEDQMKELFNKYHEKWTKPFEQVLPKGIETNESA